MADEARLNELLDLVEQSRAEGDKETEGKAIAAYRRESAAPARFGTGKSLDVMEDGSLTPSEDVHYTGAGPIPASSGLAQREKKYGATAGFDFSVKPEDVRDVTQSLNAIPRGAVKGINAIPTMAADAGVQGRNLLTGSNYELPSQMYEREVYDRFLPMANTPAAKGTELLTSMLAGAKLPAPQIKNPAPANFVKPSSDLVRQQTLGASQRAGYVVPPATTNPTAANTFLESLGGKVGTAQDAATRNQATTNTLAKRALGLNEDAPLSLGSLSAVRKEAGDAYQTLRAVDTVPLTDDVTKTLDGLSEKFSGTALKKVLGGNSDIPQIVQAIKSEPLNGDAAVDAMALLRDKADAAYRAGSKELGKAYKQISKTLEDLMESKLSGEALKSFRNARQLIAKSHTVEGAFNSSTGNVVATDLATQLGRGKPLSGDLLTAARFGEAFPKVARETLDSGAVRNTDAIMGAGAGVLTKEPWWLGYPFLRQGTRSFLLSKPGQNLARQSQGGNGIPPEVAMGLLGLGEQGRQSLLK